MVILPTRRHLFMSSHGTSHLVALMQVESFEMLTLYCSSDFPVPHLQVENHTMHILTHSDTALILLPTTTRHNNSSNSNNIGSNCIHQRHNTILLARITIKARMPTPAEGTIPSPDTDPTPPPLLILNHPSRIRRIPTSLSPINNNNNNSSSLTRITITIL